MGNLDKLAQTGCFVLDMDGTVYLEDQLLPGAAEFIGFLEQHKIAYIFLTNNSSRQRHDYAEKLARLGLKVPAERIFTSGEATALYLQQHAPDAALFVVGTPSLEDEFRSHGFRLVTDQPGYVVLGFDTTLTYAKLWKLCDLVRTGIPYIATHADYNCPIKGGYMPDVGAMIAFVEASTGRRPDVVIGKPNAPIVHALAKRTGFPVDRLTMVGDRLYTDIALGKTGMQTVLVLSGETKIEGVKTSPFQPDYIVANLGELRARLQEMV